jgi:Tol biopolymer transport system component
MGEGNSNLSPDEKWLVHAKWPRGVPEADEIYVSEFPDGVTRKVSVGGGTYPTWSRDGREIFYRSYDGWMMSVSFEASPTLRPGQPQRLFEWDVTPGSPTHYTYGGGTEHYDVAADGRFLMLKERPPREPLTTIHLVQGWLDELKRQVPTGR